MISQYVLEVDLKYPVELHVHDFQSDSPLAPESFQIKTEMLSPYQKELVTELEMNKSTSTNLVPNDKW